MTPLAARCREGEGVVVMVHGAWFVMHVVEVMFMVLTGGVTIAASIANRDQSIECKRQ